MSKQTFVDAVVIIAECVAKNAVTKASNWSRMQPKEPDDMSLGYSSNSGAHAFVGYGYTGNYYKVRDTWTADGLSDGGTRFLYNSSAYNYRVITISMPNTTWRSGTLRKGDDSIDVKRLETLLYDLWYDPGTINNVFDSNTESAVKAFQRDYGLTEDGIVGPATFNKLVNAHSFMSSSPRVLSSGRNGDDVAEMQARLRAFAAKKGYSLIQVDGMFGSATNSLLKKFQAYAGLTQDGICGAATYNALKNSSFPADYDN